MIKKIDHVGIQISKEEHLKFYEKLGFKEVKRNKREGKDLIVFMEGYGEIIEMFIGPNHPKRLTDPEAFGMKHLALTVDNVEETLKELDVKEHGPIFEFDGLHVVFFNDPDGLPIELHEEEIYG